ncbi:unnamed protein product [Camellia sinensis]
MSTMASDAHSLKHYCFEEWINLQQEDLSELLQGLSLNPNIPDHHDSLSQLTQKNVQHFQEYIDKRRHLARDHISAYFAPSWCNSLESSLLWIAGCRPSLFIRLTYALCGLEIESRLTEFLQGARTGDFGELTASQITLVNSLQGKTIREEDKLTTRLASLQEDITDKPLAVMEASQIGELNCDTDKALDEHGLFMATMLVEADQLRMSTLKELVGIFTPIQAVDFLAVTKKLRLCMHEWGTKRDDHMYGTDKE